MLRVAFPDLWGKWCRAGPCKVTVFGFCARDEAMTTVGPVDLRPVCGLTGPDFGAGRDGSGVAGERESGPEVSVFSTRVVSWTRCPWCGRSWRVSTRADCSFPPNRNLAEIPQDCAAVGTAERFCDVIASGFGAGWIRCLVLRDPAVLPEFRTGGVEGFAAAAVGEDSEVADPVEAVRQDMGHEPCDEVLGGEGLRPVAGFALPGKLRPPAAEGNGLAVEGEDAAVADGVSSPVQN